MQKRDMNGKIIRKQSTAILGGDVIDECIGCENQIAGLCLSYQFPATKWRLGNCPMATHVTIRIAEEGKARIGQQKQLKKTK